jgi:hypothetical protein
LGSTGFNVQQKILQINSKPAVEKNDWPGKFGGYTAAEFWQKRPKKIF